MILWLDLEIREDIDEGIKENISNLEKILEQCNK